MSSDRPVIVVAFERQARQLATGFAATVSSAQRDGIMEKDLSELRRFTREELATQQASIDHLDRQISSLQVQRLGLRSDRQGRALLSQADALITKMRRLRDITVIVRDAYRDGLKALDEIEPKRLTEEDYAAIRAIDARLEELRARQ